MSDYFRYYCDGLDEPRMLYAMHKCSHVHTVWVWTLCECGRTKRNQIERPSNAMLVGLGHKLNVPVGSLQECLNLLVEIEYLQESDGAYIVRKWNDLQSKYMQEKAWKESHKNQKKPKETKNPIGEERRGEEKEHSAEFYEFWNAYPRRVGQKAAARAWDKAKDRPAIEVILAAVKAQSSSDQWTKDGGQYIPHPATWLNQGRWADQSAPPPKPAAPGRWVDPHADVIPGLTDYRGGKA